MNSNRTSKERAQKTAKGRCSDQNYYLSKNLSAKYIELSPNPTFTEEDRQKKMEIFGVPDLKTCFITEQPSKGVGDHFKEINGYYAKTGMRGIDDEWNILPVSGSQNKSYKIMEYVIDGKKIKSCVDDMTLIAGQKAIITKYKKSIANFKTRKGTSAGIKVTLRSA